MLDLDTGFRQLREGHPSCELWERIPLLYYRLFIAAGVSCSPMSTPRSWAHLFAEAIGTGANPFLLTPNGRVWKTKQYKKDPGGK